MPEKIEITIEEFDIKLADEDEGCRLELTGEDGEKVVIHMDREKAEEFADELYQLLGLGGQEEDDD